GIASWWRPPVPGPWGPRLRGSGLPPSTPPATLPGRPGPAPSGAGARGSGGDPCRARRRAQRLRRCPAAGGLQWARSHGPLNGTAIPARPASPDRRSGPGEDGPDLTGTATPARTASPDRHCGPGGEEPDLTGTATPARTGPT